MASSEMMIAIIAGFLQGIFEWLPISSEGNITAILTVLGSSPGAAVRFSLFLHIGTALAALTYYRTTLIEILSIVPQWRPDSAFTRPSARLSFLGLATVSSGVVALIAFSVLEAVVSQVAGGLLVAVIGVLLVVTGLFELRTRSVRHGQNELPPDSEKIPTPQDAVLIGILQGLAILPGISRSGTTVGGLLLRGYSGYQSFQLSFILSIPASIGAGLLVLLGNEGIILTSIESAFVAIVVSAGVGYLSIDLLMKIVRRVSFGIVCLAIGLIAIAGGVLLL